MTTPFEQSVIDALEPLYQQMCKDTEGMLDELPPGSTIGTYEHGYFVQVPGGLFAADTVAEAYKMAMEAVTGKRVQP